MKMSKLFTFKDGHLELGIILSESPYTYFVQFGNKLFGTIWKSDLIKADKWTK